jgi:7-cyano-7-deazaguanine reductase
VDRITLAGESQYEPARLFPSAECDLDLPTNGIELEEVFSGHEVLSHVSRDEMPTVVDEHVIARLLASPVGGPAGQASCPSLPRKNSDRPGGADFKNPGMAERADLKNLSLLGKAKLEVFPNQRPGRKYWITLNCPEFSSLCPVTGQPDAARIVIRYVPREMIVETKSLKFYLASFRNQPAFNEEIVNRILDDLVSALQPQELIVRGEFAPRGGIQLTTEATYPEPS